MAENSAWEERCGLNGYTHGGLSLQDQGSENNGETSALFYQEPKMKNSSIVISMLAAGAGLLYASVGAQEPIQVLQPVQNVNLAQVELGKKLYFDPRLSKSGFISCNSCHNLS
ncbi:cytochrome c peroxidase, partial [Thiolapillus sp.]|uniref:cytochrome c peroxidase n=2 Tax=Thiolapillus sp. TaxID=2017437 RepID=UPI003AF9C560